MVLLGLAGCRSGDHAQQRVTMRADRLANVINTIEERERKRPAQLERSVELIGARVARARQASRANTDECERYWRRSWERWAERLPVCEQRAGEILGGKPRRIERTAVILFL